MKCLFVWLLLLVAVESQTCDPGSDTFSKVFGGLCDKTFSDANATGFYSFDPNEFQKTQPNINGKTPNVTWAHTLSVNGDNIQAAIWFSPGGVNYTNDLALDYDVCYIQVNGLVPLARYKGQQDDGSCSSTLDSDCINALEEMAQSKAGALTNSPDLGEHTNLTGHVLPICNEIGNHIKNNFPSQCKKYFTTDQHVLKGLPVVLTQAFTDFNNTNPDNTCISNTGYGCSIHDPDMGTFWPVDGYYLPGVKTSSQQEVQSVFNYVSRQIFPSMLVWMSVPDSQRTSSVPSIAKLSCLHVDKFSPETKTPPPLSPPPGTNTGLSGGAIAGIVVGSVVGALLIAGFAFWIFWRRRRANKRNSAARPNELEGESERKEMGESKLAGEMEGENRTELSSDANKKHELGDGSQEVHEMPAELNLPELGEAAKKPDKKEKDDDEDGNEYHAS